MSETPGFLSAALTPEHNIAAFTSGQPSLDAWLRDHALRAQEAGTARTRVWVRHGSQDVVAYYSIAPTQLIRAEGLSRSLSGGSSVVPAFLLARLALGSRLQGQGLGAELLLDALQTVVAAAQHGGGRLVVVDAIDDRARTFYKHHDFLPIGDGRRLVIKIATVEAVLEALSGG